LPNIQEEHMWTRRLFVSGLMLAPLAAGAAAQDYPTKPVRIVVPFTAGSGTDLVARIVADQLSNQLGQRFTVENRGGAGGTLGAGMVAKADPDGYTLLIHSSTHVVAASTYSDPGYNTRTDFAPVTALVSLPNVLVTPAGKYKSLKHLVEHVRANPGKLNYASGGAGSAAHLNAERFLRATGLEMAHLPFRGGPEGLRSVMAGDSEFYFIPLPAARALIEAGKLDALAVSSIKRASALPNVPSTVEAGYPDSEYNFWVGMYAPARTPKAIVERLNAETVKALADPGVKERLAKIGADPMPMPVAEFEKFVQREIDINAELVKATGVKVN
jgi:tripartite-type tricarboxylate transporter receptor subunit TctC